MCNGSAAAAAASADGPGKYVRLQASTASMYPIKFLTFRSDPTAAPGYVHIGEGLAL